MNLLKKIGERASVVRGLRRTLRPHPGHFRALMLSLAGNVARLALLKIRLGLAGRKLVVIGLPERLGDIVACEPVAPWVRGQHPGDYVLWAVRPAYLGLLENNPHLDAACRVHCLTEWIWLRKLGLFDRVYDLNIDKRCCDKCNYKLLREEFGEGAEVNMANYLDFGSLLGSFSRAAGIPMLDGDPAVYVDRRARDAVDRLGLPPRYVTIHTTSEDGIKDWEPGKWRELIDRIVGAGEVAVVELGLRSPLGRPDGEGYVNLCGRCGLLESAEVIRRSSLFIGIDSGPSHLANAAKTRGVILLGDYMTFGQYMPYTGFYSDPANCRILRSEGRVAEIPVELCLSAVSGFEESSGERPKHAPQLGSI